MLLNLCMVTETGAIAQRVIKGHQIIVYGATSTCKNRGSMDPAHNIYFDGPGPWARFTEGVHVLYFPGSIGQVIRAMQKKSSY